VARITLTCKLAVASALLGLPALVVATPEDAVGRYAAARLAEIGNRDADALRDYVKLYRDAPNSDVLIDRIFDSAIRAGDMAAALRAVRAQELRGEVSGEAPLLLFADAFRQKNWPMAMLAADELSVRGNFGFMAPILRSWVNLAQGNSADFSSKDDPLLAFYSTDQRIYLQLASGDYAKAKLGLRVISATGGDYVRDLMLTAAPVIAAQGDENFADALRGTALGADQLAFAGLKIDKKRNVKLSAEDGLSALHVRIAAALLEQNVNDQALVLARIAYLYAPENGSAKLMLANALEAQGLDDQASALVQSIQPNSYYWPQAVRQRVANMPPDKGLTLARDAARALPKAQSLALLTAQSQAAAGDLAGAVESYRNVVEMSAKDGTSPRQGAYYQLLFASALDNSGNWTAARTALDAALVMDPDNPQILNYLGYSLLERNEDVSRAIAMIRQAFEIIPDSPAIIDSMGWAHFQTGDFAKAVGLLETAVKKSGNDPAMNEHLGDAYWRSGRMRDARYAWGVASQYAENEAAARLAGKIDIGLISR
jgi:Flp pilus assembly protein TadD